MTRINETRRRRPPWVAAIALSLPAALAAEPFPAEIDLSSLDPTNGGDGSVGVIFQGATPDNHIGESVAGGGDIDGDGLDDLLLGAPGPGPCRACAAHAVFGRTEFPAAFDLIETAIQTKGHEAFVLNGIPQSLHSSAGRSVTVTGDLNADGLPDLIVGAESATPDGASTAGEVLVIFGRSTGFPPFFETSDLLAANGGDGSAGFVLLGAQSLETAGYSVSSGCDVNDDGVDDLIVGAPQIDEYGGSPGRAYIVFGQATRFPPEFGLARLLPANGGDGSEGVVLEGLAPGGRTGQAVICAQDTNADGIDDFAIAAPFADAEGASDAGEAYLLFGRRTWPAVFDLASLLPENGGDGGDGSVIQGIDTSDFAGIGLGTAHANADALADLLVSVSYADPGGRSDAGSVHVVFGRSEGFPPVFALARLLPENGGDGHEGFVMNGIHPGDQAGNSVAGAGDVNGDGVEDLVVGAPFAHSASRRWAGEVYLVFGRLQMQPVFELARLFSSNGGDGSEGVVLMGGTADELAGIAVGPAGDANGDGARDVLIGAPRASLGALQDTGKAYLLFGRPSDTDSDGVPQSQDNCTETANADQRDTDGDGIGNACDADLNQDCSVNFGDLGLLKAVFFTTDPDADFSGDGNVNFIDLGIMQSGFFLPPGPSGVANACSGA